MLLCPSLPLLILQDCCNISGKAVRINRRLGPELSGEIFFNIGQYFLVFWEKVVSIWSVFWEKVVSIVVSILTFFYRPQLSSLPMALMDHPWLL